ncbi:MAG: hypothetical protein KHX53_01350 [Bacteroides sp.]|nr:hypothetical protein [Bacteroides sp.]
MKLNKLIALPLFMTLFSCNSDEKKAEELFQRAESSFATGDYSLAKLQIDSIRTLYPKAFEVRKAGIKLMQQVDLQEQQKTLVYLDSVMAVKQASLDSIKGNFVLEKDTAYQEVGNYFYPTQTVEKNIGRSFLRGQVNERGEMSITSIYCAGGKLHHRAVKVSVDDLFAETPISPDCYETTDLGKAIEKADYKLGADGGVIAFIKANQDKKRIRLEFIGDRNYKTTMQPNDIKAIAELSRLAQILSSIEAIKKEQNEANLKIRFVNRKIEEAATNSAAN